LPEECHLPSQADKVLLESVDTSLQNPRANKRNRRKAISIFFALTQNIIRVMVVSWWMAGTFSVQEM
jgi:hypothetical protein